MSKPIEISGLDVQYPSVRALESVSFDVNEGDFLGIIGPNGAGKSTLFSCILGLHTKYDGTVRIFGEDIHKSRNALKKVGYVPQKMHFERNFPVTAKEVVRMGLWHGVDEDRIDKVMQDLWIHELGDRRIGELSGGQQQRVFIAKAIVNDPKLLIMDEPITGVDQSSINLFYSILKDLNSNHNITIVWSSHDLDAVDLLANQVVCLNKKLYFHGSTDAFFEDENMAHMYSGCSLQRHNNLNSPETSTKLITPTSSNNTSWCDPKQ